MASGRMNKVPRTPRLAISRPVTKAATRTIASVVTAVKVPKNPARDCWPGKCREACS